MDGPHARVRRGQDDADRLALGPERPELAVGPRKQIQVRRLARAWLAENAPPPTASIRFDVIGVSLDPGDSAISIAHLPNAFERSAVAGSRRRSLLAGGGTELPGPAWRREVGPGGSSVGAIRSLSRRTLQGQPSSSWRRVEANERRCSSQIPILAIASRCSGSSSRRCPRSPSRDRARRRGACSGRG